jgi:hypothetical protein
LTQQQEGIARRIFAEIKEYGIMDRMKDAIQDEEKRGRLAKKLEMENRWLSRRQKVSEKDPGHGVEVDMDWEEHSLEACLAMLGLEAWDNTEPMEIEELEDEEDWLDSWIKSLAKTRDDEEMEIPVTELADMAMEQESIEMKNIEMGYVTWLVEELKEMRIDEEVLECIRKMACQGDCDGLCEEGVNDECVRNVHCLGMCGGSCGPDLDLTDVEYGSSLQIELSSTLDECIRNVQCPGACKDACVTDSIASVLVNEKGSSLQSGLGSPQVHGTHEIEHYSRANMDWGRVGGAVQNLEGVSINDIAWAAYF